MEKRDELAPYIETFFNLVMAIMERVDTEVRIKVRVSGEGSRDFVSEAFNDVILLWGVKVTQPCGLARGT